MSRWLLIAAALALFLTGCAPAPAPVDDRVHTFYYGWYATPEVDGRWANWESPRLSLVPPADITSDYYPLLGTYSSSDPVMLARHMAWIRKAGIGVLI